MQICTNNLVNLFYCKKPFPQWYSGNITQVEFGFIWQIQVEFSTLASITITCEITALNVTATKVNFSLLAQGVVSTPSLNCIFFHRAKHFRFSVAVLQPSSISIPKGNIDQKSGCGRKCEGQMEFICEAYQDQTGACIAIKDQISIQVARCDIYNKCN